MAEDWAVDVKKYVPDANEKAIAGIVRHCGIALHNRDSSLVAFSDKEEVNRVKDHFLKKKLALTLPDAEIDQALHAVGEKMKADHSKNRVTVYYLLSSGRAFRQARPVRLNHGRDCAGPNRPGMVPPGPAML